MPRGVARLGAGRQAADDQDDSRARLDLAAAQRLDERAECSAAGAVGLDPDRLGEQLGVRCDRCLADCEHGASRRSRSAEGEVAVRRVADGE